MPNIPIAVSRVEIVGATLFNTEVRSFANRLIGPATPLTQLDKARQEILRYYRSRGYALTSVSLAIDRNNGVARYTVIEGHVVAVKLDGDIGPAGSMVLRSRQYRDLRPGDGWRFRDGRFYRHRRHDR